MAPLYLIRQQVQVFSGVESGPHAAHLWIQQPPGFRQKGKFVGWRGNAPLESVTGGETPQVLWFSVIQVIATARQIGYTGGRTEHGKASAGM